MGRKKVALVTGASSGLGKDFTKALLKEGIIVYAVARRLEHMNDLKAMGAIIIKMDITKKQDRIDVIQKILADNKQGIDILINNAGFGLFGSVEEISIEDAQYQFEVNLFGLAHITQLTIPCMRKNKSGKIINISSIAGKIYSPLSAWYYSTKHALEGWSDCLRVELKQFDINVIIIEPGVIRTGFGSQSFNDMSSTCVKNNPYYYIKKKFIEMKNIAPSAEIGVITSILIRAIKSKKPKIRYAGGKYVKSILFFKKIFSDSIFDKIILRIFK